MNDTLKWVISGAIVGGLGAFICLGPIKANQEPTPPTKPLELPTTIEDLRYIQVFVDPLTNCHYLGRSGTALTPRFDTEGKQICITKESK